MVCSFTVVLLCLGFIAGLPFSLVVLDINNIIPSCQERKYGEHHLPISRLETIPTNNGKDL